MEDSLKEAGSGLGSVSLAALPRYRSFLKISLDRPLQVFFLYYNCHETVLLVGCEFRFWRAWMVRANQNSLLGSNLLHFSVPKISSYRPFTCPILLTRFALRLVLNPTYILISLGQGMDAFIISGLSGNHHFMTSLQILRTFSTFFQTQEFKKIV